MARKSTPAKPVAKSATPKVVARKPVASTPVRNTPIPKVAAKAAVAAAPVVAPAKKVVTHDMIAFRAYEISRSGTGGSEFDNWIRAERELRGV
jgi:hypothetical protein